MEPRDSDAELRQFARRRSSELKYDDVSSPPAGRARTFTVRAVLDGKAYASGVGETMEEAKQKAAENAMRCLMETEKHDPADPTVFAEPVYRTNIADTKYVTLLSEYCQKNKISIKPVESIRLDTYLKCCSFVVGGQQYPAAVGKTKKEAKEEAAKIAYQSLGVKPKQQYRGTNFIGIVDIYCQKTGRIYNFREERRSGPSEKPEFFCKLVINEKEYPVGVGKTIKEAKQNAAQLAWSALQEQSDWNSKVSLGSNVSVDSALTRESLEASSQRSASDSVIFTDSSTPSKEQDAVKNQNNENSPIDESTLSRFTSEFDSIESLAKGGFGCVYKARERLVDKFYAVKIVRSKEKALREVAALSELLHPNIVRYYNCWKENSAYQWDNTTDSYSTSQSSSDSLPQYLYIKMELCDRRTLKDWIKEKNKETLLGSRRGEESLPIARQIISGVDCIHFKKLIHRDLKPANIMFGLDGEVKIGDFGLVTAEMDDDDENLVERTNKTGTRSYMAPEQRSKKTYDRKVDIFALGLIYIELLWNLSTDHERGMILTNARSQRLPKEFSLAFPRENQIILSMLCEKPEDRPEARTLKAELEKWAETTTATEAHTHQDNVNDHDKDL